MAGIVNGREMSQKDALDFIARNNPTIVSLERTCAADAIGAKGVSQLSGPELEGEYMFGSGADNKWSVGITQGFDWPGAYKAKRLAAEKSVQASLIRLAAMKNEVALTARRKMIEGVYVTKQIKMLQVIYNNLDSICKAVEYGYDKGQLTILDVKKIKHELFIIDNRISDASIQLNQINSDLVVMSGDKDFKVEFTEYEPQPLLPLNQYYNLAETSPEVNAALAESESYRLSARAEEQSRKPSFAIGYRHSYEENHHFNGIAASIGLPSWGKNYNSKASVALAENAEFEANAITSAQIENIKANYEQAQHLKVLMNKYKDIVLDDEYVELLTMAYHGGQINVITLIQEINYYLSSSLDYLAKDYEYRDKLAQINKFCQAEQP